MTRMSNGKSYREQAAPYRRPISTRTNDKVSMFGRIRRSLFGGAHSSKPDDKDESLQSMSSHRQRGQKLANVNKRVMSSSSIPGGFFNADASNISIVPQPSENNNTIEGEMNGTNLAADISVSSNAKLANFFANKGDAALSEMEMEGVMSLMKKANTTGTNNVGPDITNGDGNEEDNESVANGTMASSRYGGGAGRAHEGKSTILRGNNLGSVNNSFKMPSFTPRYDHSTMTLDRRAHHRNHNDNTMMQRNTSFASTASSTRRVFDYNRLPSPYKTVVFRYKSINGSEPGKTNTKELLSRRHQQQHKGNERVKIDKPKKRVSNTASALLSLLDSNQNETVDDDDKDSNNNSTNLLANPYSTLVPRVRKKPIPQQTIPTVENDSVLPSEVVTPIETTTKPVVDAPIELPKRNKPEPIATGTTTMTTTTTTPEHPFKLYKPTRSSSLRSSVVAADPTTASTTATTSTTTTEEKKPEVEQAPSIFPVPGTIPSFTMKKPEHEPLIEKAPTFNAIAPPSNIFNIKTSSENINNTSTSTVPQYEFNISLPSSDIDPTTVDDKQVEQFKSLFAF